MNFNFFKIVFFVGFLAYSQTIRAEVIDRVVAKVNDQIITLSEVMERARLLKLQAGQMNLNESLSKNEIS